MKNIAKAIIEVMKEVKGMEKNSVVGSGKASYNGTKDQDVKEVFNDALSRNRLCVLPVNIDEDTKIDRWEENTNYGVKQKQSVFTKVKVKYLLLHESGESVEIVGYGHGVDTQDKGAGKATTYALKNALLYTFLTPVGKIDDSDTTHNNDIKTPRIGIKRVCSKCSTKITEDQARLSLDKKSTLLCSKCLTAKTPEQIIKNILSSVDLDKYFIAFLDWSKKNGTDKIKRFYEYGVESGNWERLIIGFVKQEIDKIDKDFTSAFAEESTLKDYADGLKILNK